jgi:hypothetical protein
MNLEKKYAKLLPLQKGGDYKPQPQHCKCAFGDSKCFKKANNGQCPTDILKTEICGGWQPRKGLPEMKRLIKIKQ